jgi:uncharacterized membrane protein YfcA
MSLGITAAIVLSGAVGVSLGALGGGGSILMVPILVYVAALPAQQAIPISLIVVGATSLIGAGAHYWRGNFHLQTAFLFGASGIVGSYTGSYLTHLFSDRVLLGIFAALMVIVGSAMLRQRPQAEESTRCSTGRCLVSGFIVGVLTGFLGVGGGFLIVPALIMFAGLPAQKAVGTSLAIITLSAAGGVVGQMKKTTVDWPLAAQFAAPAIVGMFGGFAVAEKLAGRKLQKVFAGFIIILGVVIGALTASGLSVATRR